MDGPLQQCVGQNEALWLCGVPLSGGKHRLTPEKATAASRKARSPLLARPRSVSLWRLAAPEPRLRRAGGCARSYRRRRCCCRCGRPLPTLIGIERKVPTDPLDTNTSLARSSQKLPPDERNATVASGLFGAGSIETVHAYRPPNRGHRLGASGTTTGSRTGRRTRCCQLRLRMPWWCRRRRPGCADGAGRTSRIRSVPPPRLALSLIHI